MVKEVLWKHYSSEQLGEMEKICDRYKYCLDTGKTERESARLTVQMAEEAGYVALDDIIRIGETLQPGDKVYSVYNEKLVLLYHIGTEPMENGMNILGAHIDSPRMDLKQNPLYDKGGFAYFDTHYYGGIKKYQWVTIPLALHGVVVRPDGTSIEVNIGEDENDPVFTVTDLLIHLSGEQLTKTAAKVIEGESLDLLIGSIPGVGPEDAVSADDDAVADGSAAEASASVDAAEEAGDGDSSADADKKAEETVQANILRIIKDKYGFDEEDFISAEIEVVPAGKARDLGLDRSMIMAYGHDDRICAFTSLMALLDSDAPKRTSCCILVDKEEVGSMGASGMQSRYFENMTAEVLHLMGHDDNLTLRRTLQNSKMLSSDVSAGFDPLYANVFETKNAAFLGKGPVFNKYTGARGKSGSSDANPEYIASIRKVLADNDVQFQTAELGKVDAGGGGTIAYIMANYGMEVIDCGVAVLCMHAPMEIASKADIYETYRAYMAFLKDMA